MKTKSFIEMRLSGWLSALALGLLAALVLFLPMQTRGQINMDSDLETALVAGNWQLLATNNAGGAVGHFCRAVANGVIMEWRVMEAEGKLGRAGGTEIDEFCQGILARHPKNAFARFAVATRLYDQGETTKALAEYQKAGELDPKFAPTFYQIGSHYDLKGAPTEKLKWMEKAIAADPGYSPAYLAKGTTFMAQGNLDAAEAQFKKAVAVLEAKHIQTGEQLGRACYNLGWTLGKRPNPDNDQVISVLARAIKADPLRFEAYNQLGIAYKRKSMFTEAVKTYREGIRLGDNSATIYFNLGVSEYRLGHNPEAVAAFEKAVSLDPGGQMGGTAQQWLSKIR